MNKTARKVAKKHKKARARRKQEYAIFRTSAPIRCAFGRVPANQLDNIKKTIGESELRRVVTLGWERAGKNYVTVALYVKKDSLFLLKASLEDGMLRHWGNEIIIRN